jgi:hypothetical protein
MYPLLCLAAALALGQAEPEDPPAEPPAPAHQAPAEPAAEPPPRSEPRPAAERPARPAPAQERAAPPPQEKPSPGPAARPPEAEKAQVARAALAFLDALVAGDAGALAAAAGERFSFDGDLRTGREPIRRAWQELLSARDPARHPALLDLELLTSPEAVARMGPPPTRLAQLVAARGGWVAVANLSQRPVLLFLAREGSRWVVAGIE